MPRKSNPTADDLKSELYEIMKQLVYISADLSIISQHNVADRIDKIITHIDQAVDEMDS